MKIYVITSGVYSDYQIQAVAIDETKADWLAKYYNGSVEVYDTDDAPETRPLECLYSILFTTHGEVDSIYGEYCIIHPNEEILYREKDDRVYCQVIAEDEDTAIKIASERRAKFLAERYGL